MANCFSLFLFQIQGGLPTGESVHSLGDVTSQHGDGLSLSQSGVAIDMSGQENQVATLAEATLNSDGQIVLTGADGLGGRFPSLVHLMSPMRLFFLFRYDDSCLHVPNSCSQFITLEWPTANPCKLITSRLIGKHTGWFLYLILSHFIMSCNNMPGEPKNSNRSWVH
jgi:hypothetical protein